MRKALVVIAVLVGSVAPVAVAAQADAGATSWRDTGWDCKGC